MEAKKKMPQPTTAENGKGKNPDSHPIKRYT